MLSHMHKLLFATCFLGFTLSASSDFKMEKILTDAKKIIKISKQVTEKVEAVINTIKIVDDKIVIDELVSDPDIELCIDYIHDNPTILQALQGSLRPKPNMLAKAVQLYTGISTAGLHKLQGAILGIAGYKIVALTANALMPSTVCSILPTGYMAVAAVSAIGCAGYLVYKYMPVPTTIFETAVSKSVHLASKIAPYIGIGLAGSLQAVQAQNNHAIVQPMARDLIKTITAKQKELLSQKNILLLAYLFPELLLQEIKFLDALSEHQIDLMYNLFDTRAPDKKNKFFEQFVQALTPDQVKIIKPNNKLLLALFNPAILHLSQNKLFLESLTDKQSELLAAALKSS